MFFLGKCHWDAFIGKAYTLHFCELLVSCLFFYSIITLILLVFALFYHRTSFAIYICSRNESGVIW